MSLFLYDLSSKMFSLHAIHFHKSKSIPFAYKVIWTWRDILHFLIFQFHGDSHANCFFSQILGCLCYVKFCFSSFCGYVPAQNTLDEAYLFYASFALTQLHFFPDDASINWLCFSFLTCFYSYFLNSSFHNLYQPPYSSCIDYLETE